MDSLLNHISECIDQDIIKAIPVSGGDINRAYCLHSASDRYFLKINSKSRFPGMFKAEAEGLDLIRRSNSIAVPEVILQGDHNDDSFLLLEWIDTKYADTGDAHRLGQQLAAMHKATTTKFGLDGNNYMGSLVQCNNQCDTWAEFFITQRLQAMVKMAVDKGQLSAADISKFEVVYKKLPDLFDEEAPALIHGDLWGGNYLINTNGKPYLIDPAVSYGYREFDIAMTTLFGGFNNEFYIAYNKAFPLVKGWQQRLDLWNLYPLLVHVNLFGGGYAGQVRDCLKYYV